MNKNKTTTNRTRMNLGQRLDFRMVWRAATMNTADLQTVCAFTGSDVPNRSMLARIDKSIPAARARFARSTLRDLLEARRLGVSLAVLRSAYPHLCHA